ncbi:MAG: protein kinase, partial [Proteobacteria bacterium]|nr:protein kinase [Pseudomonadota bacterium]
GSGGPHSAEGGGAEGGAAEGNGDDATLYVPAAGAGAASDRGESEATLAPGTLLSHTYRIERLLARGGMGEVYRAQHEEMGTWHAIKIILPDLVGDAKIVDLFRREAGVLRNIRHDAVVAYDGVFRDEQSRVYLVMEFVDGPSLSEVLKQRKFSPAEVRTLRDRLASGLATAHETGVIHRDMSPDNIILQDGRLENAKIIDFGIAKLADPDQATIIGDDFAGKLSYVSPEQLGMFGGAVDGRSDIYSLGLLLAAAAIGRPLNMGGSPMAVLEARKAVPDLSAVPAELRDELSAMLQPDPADRAQTMRALISTEPPGPPGSPGSREPAPRADAPAPWETDGPAAAHEKLDDSEAAAAPGAGPPVVRETGRSKAPLFAVLIGLAVLAGVGYGGYVMFLTPPTEAPAPEPIPLPEPEPEPPVPTPIPEPEPEPPVPIPTPPAEPEPEPEPEPPAPDLTGRNTAVDLALRDVACGNVGGRFDDSGALRLIGHLPSEGARQALRARLRSMSGVGAVDDDALIVLPQPSCRIVDTMPTTGLPLAPDQVAAAAELGKPTQAGMLSFRSGELLTLNLVAPDYPAFYYVDYYDNANNVIHLLPSPVVPGNQVSPRQRLRIGGIERYRISPPFGLDLVVAVGSSVPLFEGARPEVEPADAYLASLVQALRAARAKPGFRGEYSYLFVETKP